MQARQDRSLLFAAAALRALATGLMGLLLGLYLARLAIEPGALGVIVASGLAGAALAALGVTLYADRLGRRRTQVGLALLGAAGAAACALTSHPLALGIAAFAGMLNGMGRDRGAALVLDQALLPATTDDRGRTFAFAWYGVLQDVGHALGALAASLPALVAPPGGELEAIRGAFGVYALLMLAQAILYARLSPAIEVRAGSERAPITPETRRIVWRISSLFAVDSLAGGFLTASLVSYFFFGRFGADPEVIALLFFGARVLNALSHLGAAWLARRIGLVNTMVFTHIPSSLLLVTVAIAPSFEIAAMLFLLREGLVEMDVPTRQSYVMALVRPEERTFTSGITNLVRLAGWAAGPALAGALMQGTALMTPLIVGAALKIAYDLLLYRAFRGVKPPEER